MVAPVRVEVDLGVDPCSGLLAWNSEGLDLYVDLGLVPTSSPEFLRVRPPFKIPSSPPSQCARQVNGEPKQRQSGELPALRERELWRPSTNAECPEDREITSCCGVTDLDVNVGISSGLGSGDDGAVRTSSVDGTLVVDLSIQEDELRGDELTAASQLLQLHPDVKELEANDVLRGDELTAACQLIHLHQDVKEREVDDVLRGDEFTAVSQLLHLYQDEKEAEANDVLREDDLTAVSQLVHLHQDMKQAETDDMLRGDELTAVSQLIHLHQDVNEGETDDVLRGDELTAVSQLVRLYQHVREAEGDVTKAARSLLEMGIPLEKRAGKSPSDCPSNRSSSSDLNIVDLFSDCHIETFSTDLGSEYCANRRSTKGDDKWLDSRSSETLTKEFWTTIRKKRIKLKRQDELGTYGSNCMILLPVQKWRK